MGFPWAGPGPNRPPHSYELHALPNKLPAPPCVAFSGFTYRWLSLGKRDSNPQPSIPKTDNLPLIYSPPAGLMEERLELPSGFPPSVYSGLHCPYAIPPLYGNASCLLGAVIILTPPCLQDKCSLIKPPKPTVSALSPMRF